MLLHSLLGFTLLLFLTVQILSTGDCWTVSQKQRYKREWVVPARKLTENIDYSLSYIGKIRSDFDTTMQLRYTLRGPGANQPPVGCFMVEEYKGEVRVTRPLDREERENYTLIGTAWFVNNSIAEDNIKLNIIVEDQNDNAPVFINPERSSIYEGSPTGTIVTQVVAKDADEPNTPHTKIAYTLIKQEPNNGTLLFAVNKDNGTISVENPALDREKQRSYVLTVQAADMYGDPKGNSATVSVSIDILDVNDNIPTLEKDEFSASIDENTAPIEVLQIQAHDFDEERTDNWLAKFVIVSGNEDGLFSVETDPKTNMGTLYLNKPVDFESSSKLNLNLIVVNEAPPGAPLGTGAGAAGASIGAGGAASGAGGQSGASGAGGQSGASGAGGQSGASGAGGQSGASGQSGADPRPMFLAGSGNAGSSVSKPKTYSVNIDVKNKPEGPKFKPNIKPISVSENTINSVPRVIGTYTATEEGTGKPAEKVKYAKTYDPDNWISIDMDTAEIKLNKVPDRESPFVVNGTYYAKILCITDELHSQTSTGTIALQVEDLNDNCPKLIDNVQIVCSDTRELNITAEDSDSDPNGAPLEFTLIQEKTRGKWNLQRTDDVGALLLAEDDLWPGIYQVTMEIRDKQGLACPDEQVLHLEVCTCSEGTNCGAIVSAVRSSTSAKFGASGISFLVLGFLSLILVLLVLFKCECGTAEKHFIDMPFETKQHLISYCTEGKGEFGNVLMSALPILNNEGGYEMKMSNEPLETVPAMNSKITMDEMQGLNLNQTLCNGSKMVGMMQESEFGGFYYDTDQTDMDNTVRGQKQHGVFLDALLKDYLMQKSRRNDLPEEEMKSYDYEGEGSVAGSIGSCSYNESKDDLEFLNKLDSKFSTLAEVCGYRQTQSVSQADLDVVNTVETTPTTTAFTAMSSNHMANTIQPSPMEITIKSPLVTTTPSQEMVVQEPMYYGFKQPMPSNVLLSEDGLGQGVYIINGTPETDRLLNQGNSQTFAYLGSGQRGVIANGITDDSIMYSQTGPQSPVMIREGLGEANPAVIQNLSPTSNLIMMPQQQLDGIGSLQMVKVPVGLVQGNNGQGRVTLLDGSVSGDNAVVGGLGPSHLPMTLQSLYPASSQELSGPIHMNQIIVDGSFTNAKNEGQGRVILESPINGGNVLVGGQGTPKRLSMPHILAGQENSQLLVSGPFSSALNTASVDGGESRLLVGGPSILEGPVSGGNLLVAGPGQYPASMNVGTPNLVGVPQVETGQVNNNRPLVSGSFLSVPNRISEKGGESRLLASGPSILEGPSQHPLVITPRALSPGELSQTANRQLFRSKVSKVMTAMVMAPRSKGFVTQGHLNVNS